MKRAEERVIGGRRWRLTTCGAVTLGKVAASIARNGRGVFEALMGAAAKGGDGGANLLGIVLGGVGDLDTDRLVEDLVLLLGPIEIETDGAWVSRSRAQLDEFLSGDLPTLMDLCWWAVQLNFPFLSGLAARARASAQAAAPGGPPPSSATEPSRGSSPAPSSPVASPSPRQSVT